MKLYFLLSILLLTQSRISRSKRSLRKEDVGHEQILTNMKNLYELKMETIKNKKIFENDISRLKKELKALE